MQGQDNLCENIPIPIILIGSKGVVLSVNSYLECLLQLTATELLNRNITDVFHFLENAIDENEQLPTGIELLVELVGTQTANRYFNITVGGSDDENSQWLTLSHAQTENTKYHEIAVSMSQLNDALEGAGIGTWQYDVNSQKTIFSPQFKSILNLKKTDACSWDDFRHLIYGEDLQIFDAFFHQHITNGIPLNFECRMPVGRDVKWLKIKGNLFKSQSFTRVMGTLIDYSQEKETLDRLNDAIETRNIAMQVGKIGIWRAELDENNTWVWDWDDFANEMFGLPAEGKGDIARWLSTIHPEDISSVEKAIEHSLKTGDIFTQQYRAIMPNGEIRHFSGKGQVGQNILGKNCRIDGMCINQTAIHQAQRQLKKLNSELEGRVNQRTKELTQSTELAEQASQIKSDFLSMMSHELRTPMNAVIGSLDLLATTKQTLDSMDLINTAKTSAQNLVFILNDILDINKIEAGKLEIEDLAFSISEIIDNVITVFIPTASKANISLEVYEDPHIPSFVLGDAMRVRQILFNLVGNALKFTETTKDKRGRVCLKASIVESNDFVSTVSFKIIDNGIGIDHTTQEKLFMPFIQAERSTTRKYGGTGLGLTICGKLTEMMGGRIELTSEKDQGSTFDVELPFWRSQETRALDVESLSSVRVAFAKFSDDVNLQIEAYSEYLTDEGALVESFLYQRNSLKEDSFDVLFILANDLEEYGAETDDLISELSNCSRVYLAVEAPFVDEARKAFNGIKVLYSQPITRLKLVDSIKKIWQSGFELELEDLDLSELLEVEEEKPAATALKNGVLVIEDNPLNQKLMVRQLNMLGYECDIADDGEHGRDTWQKGNYKLVLTDCHMPKIDGYEMTKMIRAIEIEENRKKIPIIAVTGAAMSGDAEHCYEVGMSAFVSKPVQLSDLREVLKKWYPND